MKIEANFRVKSRGGALSMPNLDNVNVCIAKAWPISDVDVHHSTSSTKFVAACAYKWKVIFDWRIAPWEMSTVMYTLARDIGNICSVMLVSNVP